MDEPAADDQLWTTEDVSSFLKITPSGLAHMRLRGEGPPGARVGRRVLYRRADVIAWFESHIVTPGGTRG